MARRLDDSSQSALACLMLQECQEAGQSHRHQLRRCGELSHEQECWKALCAQLEHKRMA